MIGGNNLVVLDVGCGVGHLGKKLLDSGIASWVTGIELVPEYGRTAKSALNQVYIGDAAQVQLENPSCFDCFIFGDVLEHLPDPLFLLRRLRPHLRRGGIVVAGLPNVRHWPVISDLILHGEWEYSQSGVLDATHLRFFTLKSAKRLFKEAGYCVEFSEPTFNGRRYSYINRATFGLFTGFLSYRWLIRATVP